MNLGHTAEAPTQQFVGASVGDRCASCGTALATDQTYCLNCGERRGKPRFALGASATAAPSTTVTTKRTTRRPGLSSSTALVAGVGTLLLAMGVGVLIGHTDTNSGQRASAPQIITVGGTGGAASSGGAAAASTSSKAKKKAKAKVAKKSKADQAPKAQISKKQAAKAQAAAAKVLGTSKNLPPPTTKVGDKGHGPGYTKGKFTGTFFGQ